MDFIIIAIFIIGIAALNASVQAEIDTHTFLYRLFVFCALALLLIMVATQ